MFGFSEEEIHRYSRQIILPQLGGEGQKKLKQAKVLVVGAGGLGSPCTLYLAAAGIGHIGIVDFDQVELSNLQRQVLHSTSRIGMKKVDSAARVLQDLNPNLEIKTYPVKLGKDNIGELIADYDVVVDGVDNFPARYLLNDACVLTGKPLIEAGILQFDGLLMTIVPGKGPCYRCIFPEPPKPGTVPSCQEAGVVGALAGIIGVMQAMEVIKFVAGIGDPLTGKLLLVDALATDFRKITAERNSACPVCGDHPTITTLSEYTLDCR